MCVSLPILETLIQCEFKLLTAKLFIKKFHTLEVIYLTDAILNFKWVIIIQIWQNGGLRFLNLADWCHVSCLTCLKAGIFSMIKNEI